MRFLRKWLNYNSIQCLKMKQISNYDCFRCPTSRSWSCLRQRCGISPCCRSASIDVRRSTRFRTSRRRWWLATRCWSCCREAAPPNRFGPTNRGTLADFFNLWAVFIYLSVDVILVPVVAGHDAGITVRPWQHVTDSHLDWEALI